MTGAVAGPGTPGLRPPLPLIFAVTATGITANTLVAPAVPDILEGLDASRGYAGLLVGAATLPGILLAPLIGLLADRFGRRQVLLPCLVVFGVAGGLGAVAPSLWVLVALRLAQGVGSAGLINLAVVIIGDHWQGTERARMIGRNAAVLTTSLAVLPTLGGWLTEVGGWRAPFLLYPLALVTALLLGRYLPRVPPLQVAFRRQLTLALPLLRTTTVLGTLSAAMITFALIFGLLLTVLPLHLEQAFGIDATVRGLILGLPALTNTSAALMLGRLRARFGRRSLLGAALVCFVVALSMVASASGLPILVAGILLFGVGEGLMVPNLQDITVGAAPDSSRGTIVAIFVSASRLGQTTGPVVAGVGLAAVGAPATFAGGAVLAALLLVALLVAHRGARAVVGG